MGDPEVLKEWASLYGSRLLRAAWILCGDRDAAQDLVQETFTEAMTSAARFEGRSSPYAWLYGILRRRFLLQCRKKRRFLRWLSLAGRTEAGARAEWRREEPAEENGGLDPLLAAVRQLPAKHREVVLLRYIESRKIADIAALLSVSEGTVKSRLHYALRRVKTSLRTEADAVVAPTVEKAHEM